MKFTIKQLRDIINSADWNSSIDTQDMESTPVFEWNENGDEIIAGRKINQWIMKTSVALVDGADIQIEYQESVTYPEFKPNDYTATTDNGCDNWTFNFSVVDDDDIELQGYEIAELIEAEGSDLVSLSSADYSDILPTIDPEIIDTDEDTNMKTITIERDNDRDIQFSGEQIASASSSPDRAMGSNWSRETGRWTELRLYKTQSGKFICQSIGRTQWQGEHDRFSAAICETTDQIIDFFGTGWLAKDLYNNAGIECIETIE